MSRERQSVCDRERERERERERDKERKRMRESGLNGVICLTTGKVS